ncbi:MAG: cation:proton antiporter [Candidatus Izemoplasmatales bacterium]|nr:cation:proton antiporter [Candidatus Izemoplasmatales bacterium]
MDLTILFYAGLLLIAGLLFGKLTKLIKMPTVTGYLIVGLLIGPSILGIITEEAIGSLELVSNVALGFIAFSIGNELKLSYFKKVGMGPIIIAILESLLAVIFVLIAFVIYFAITGQLSVDNLRFALVLSAIAAATAPAATLMVVRQYKAKEPMTDMLMSVVAIDDGTTIIFFGICVAISNMLGNASSSTPMILQVLEPLWEIVVSLGIGGIIGVLLSLGCKFWTGRGNRISLVVALIFLTLYLSELAGGSSLLACMALGGVFANMSHKYEEVNGLIYFVTPPIFIMFFVLSGADLKLSSLLAVGIIGVIYLVIRLFGKVFGTWLGAKWVHADPNVGKYMGLALLPQAGVAIGLSIIASQALPGELGAKIRVIVLCSTLVCELIGPILTKIALKKSGEIPVKE